MKRLSSHVLDTDSFACTWMRSTSCPPATKPCMNQCACAVWQHMHGFSKCLSQTTSSSLVSQPAFLMMAAARCITAPPTQCNANAFICTSPPVGGSSVCAATCATGYEGGYAVGVASSKLPHCCHSTVAKTAADQTLHSINELTVPANVRLESASLLSSPH
jgi:hypothetical protein